MMSRDGRSVYTSAADGNRMWKPMRDHQNLRPNNRYTVYRCFFLFSLHLDVNPVPGIPKLGEICVEQISILYTRVSLLIIIDWTQFR